MREVLALLVIAHRNQDWESAKRYSQIKQKIRKRMHNHCEVCGKAIAATGRFCAMCWRIRRFKQRRIAKE